MTLHDRADADKRRLAWDERHRAGDFEGHGPNPTLAATLAEGDPSGPPGTALELACGSGTNAVWLAGRGWNVTAVDWSPIGLENGRAKAAETGVSIDWLERDLFSWLPPARAFDLVVVVYLHLPPQERSPVYSHAAAAVAPGGRLVIIGHDRLQALEGVPGPDPDRLFTAGEIAAPLVAADPELRVEQERVVRRVAPPEHGPIDALLTLRRQGPAEELPQ